MHERKNANNADIQKWYTSKFQKNKVNQYEEQDVADALGDPQCK